jgi:DNA-binding transcriptional regulator YhcF (GntR family)
MELITAPSKTDQIANILRSSIKKGKLMPGSKLSSIRDLSDHFKVSKRIVGCALEQLEQEKLIRREHGRGVFIEDVGKDDELDVYMLLWGIKNEPNNYIDELIKISYQPVLRDGFSFFVRTVVTDSEEYRDLDREIARIANFPHIKCVLVNATPFNELQIEKLKSLPCPVIFFGDSSFSSLSDIKFNQVTGNNKVIGEKCTTFMGSNGFKKITLFSLSQECYFYKLFCDGALEQAKKLGIDVAFYELPPEVHNLPAKEIEKVYERFIAEANNNNDLDRPIIINALREQFFIPFALKYGRMNKNVPVILPEFDSKYFGKFYDIIFETIQDTVNFPQKIHKQLVDVDFVISDWVAKKKYHAQKNDFITID